MRLPTESLRQLIKDLLAHGREVGSVGLRPVWEAADHAWVNVDDGCWQQLTQTCRELGIAVPEHSRPLAARYYRGCRG